MKTRLIALAALGLCAGLDAQRTTVHPEGYASKDANTASNRPWAVTSSNAQFRQYHWQEVRTLGNKVGVIRGIALRRDNVTRAGGPGVKYWVEIEIAISTAKTTPATMSRTFTANEGSDRLVVLKRKKLNITSFPFVNNAKAQPFFYKLAFDTGKILPFKGGNLCIDVRTYDNDCYDATSRQYKYHYIDEAYTTTGTINRNTRRGCYSSNSAVFLPVYGYSYAYQDTANNRWRMNGYSYNAPTTGVGIQIFAAQALPNSVKFPGTDCFLHINPGTILFTVPGAPRTTNASSTWYYPPYQGNTRQYAYLPFHKALSGVTLNVQFLILDKAANSLGFATGPLNTMEFPRTGGLGMATVYDYYTGVNNATARYSYVAARGRGSVMQITY